MQVHDADGEVVHVDLGAEGAALGAEGEADAGPAALAGPGHPELLDEARVEEVRHEARDGGLGQAGGGGNVRARHDRLGSEVPEHEGEVAPSHVSHASRCLSGASVHGPSSKPVDHIPVDHITVRPL